MLQVISYWAPSFALQRALWFSSLANTNLWFTFGKAIYSILKGKFLNRCDRLRGSAMAVADNLPPLYPLFSWCDVSQSFAALTSEQRGVCIAPCKHMSSPRDLCAHMQAGGVQGHAQKRRWRHQEAQKVPAAVPCRGPVDAGACLPFVSPCWFSVQSLDANTCVRRFTCISLPHACGARLP